VDCDGIVPDPWKSYNVIFLPTRGTLEYQHLSSSLVRRTIRQNPKDTIGWLPSPLSDVILTHNYYSKKITALKIARYIFGDDDTTLEITVKPEDVFIMHHNTHEDGPNEDSVSTIVIKCYENTEECEKESNGLKSMMMLNIPCPRILARHDDILALSFEGRDMVQVLETSDVNPHDLGATVGQLLKRLHTSNMTSSSSAGEISQLRQYKKLLSKCTPRNRHLYDLFLQNPGELTPIHGDACFHNIVIRDDLSAAFIDCGGFEMASIPAYDYYQFLSSLRFYKVPHSEEVTAGFIQAYDPSWLTQEARVLCSQIWKIAH
jgi:aminoglycoside phosphotransferase